MASLIYLWSLNLNISVTAKYWIYEKLYNKHKEFNFLVISVQIFHLIFMI